jgi:hypothetical protein
VLWSALDAFVASGLPKTEAFAALERSATHEHTRFRMLSGEERGKVTRERIAAEEAAQAQIPPE